MANYDVKCPIGYGLISFVGGGTSRSCPVSGESYCKLCKVQPFNDREEDHHVTKSEDLKKH